LDEKKPSMAAGKKVRFKGRKDSKGLAQSGNDGLSDMDSDGLEELVD
jgi:hypothetical protein